MMTTLSEDLPDLSFAGHILAIVGVHQAMTRLPPGAGQRIRVDGPAGRIVVVR